MLARHPAHDRHGRRPQGAGDRQASSGHDQAHPGHAARPSRSRAAADRLRGRLRRSELVALDVGDLERTPDGIFVTSGDRRQTRKAPATKCRSARQQAEAGRGSSTPGWLAAGITVGALFRPIGKGGRVIDSG